MFQLTTTTTTTEKQTPTWDLNDFAMTHYFLLVVCLRFDLRVANTHRTTVNAPSVHKNAFERMVNANAWKTIPFTWKYEYNDSLFDKNGVFFLVFVWVFCKWNAKKATSQTLHMNKAHWVERMNERTNEKKTLSDGFQQCCVWVTWVSFWFCWFFFCRFHLFIIAHRIAFSSEKLFN